MCIQRSCIIKYVIKFIFRVFPRQWREVDRRMIKYKHSKLGFLDYLLASKVFNGPNRYHINEFYTAAFNEGQKPITITSSV